MFRLLRDDCFFINHHHHSRITLPTIHFRQPNLTQFCLSLFELWLVSPKVFWLLRDGNFNFVSHNPSFHVHIAECKTTVALCNLTHFDPYSICGCLSGDLSLLRCFGYLGMVASSSTATATSSLSTPEPPTHSATTI